MSRVYFHTPDGESVELGGAERYHLASIARRPAASAWGLNIDTFLNTVSFHTPHGRTAELPGAEGYHLGLLARGPAEAAWGVEADAFYPLERAAEIIAMLADEQPHLGAGTAARLRVDLANVLGEPAYDAERFKTLPMRPPRGARYKDESALLSTLRMYLRGADGSLLLRAAGQEFWAGDVAYNTALVAGSPTVALAAKIDAYCETHGWIEGPDRAWAADLIDQALDTGLYRRGLWYLNGPADLPAARHPARIWTDLGWGQVLDLLRERADEPVVLGYTTTGGFPNPQTHPGFPLDRDKPPSRYTAHEQDLDEEWSETWGRLAGENFPAVFTAGLDWLRAHRPWARIAPDTLTGVAFGPPVTIYDLFAPDRDERIRAAFAAPEFRLEPSPQEP